jgi:uncharacterized protein (TIGR02118 family)
MLRLIGLWTEAADIDAFERDYLGTHLPLVRGLPNAQAVTSSRCLDGAYFRMTEVSFSSKEDLDAALSSDVGTTVLAAATVLQEKYGVRLEILVVADSS